MGNASSSAEEGKDTSGLDDLSCLDIQNAAIFNDSYASEMYGSLPEYDGTELVTAGDETEAKNQQFDLNMKRLLEVFGKAASTSPCVEDFEDLRVGGADAVNAEFLNMVKVRTRLLQRIHYAYSRKFNMKSSKAAGSFEEKFLRPSRSAASGFDNADALLTATSIKMSLSIMACLGPQNPELFRQFSASLQDLLSRCPPLALSQVLSGSPQGESVRAIVDYAGSVVARSSGEDCAHALSLMLALAISSGSLGDVLKMVMHLKDGSEVLPPSTAPFLKRLEGMNTELKLSWPTPSTIIGDFRAKLSLDDSEKEKTDFCSTIAGDGTYLFVWDGLSKSIAKLGTGFHGTIAGTEYMVNSDIESQLKERLGASVYGSINEESEEADSADVETAAVQAAPEGPRRLRMIREGLLVVIGEDENLEECFENEVFDDTDMLEEGFEADIVSEHQLNYPSTDHMCTVFGIGDNRYVISVEAEEASDTGSEHSEESDEVRYVRALEVIEPVAESVGGSRPQKNGNRSKAYVPARIASANGKIYLWMSYLLGPFRVAVFSASGLRLEDIENVRLPIPELIKGRKVWERSLASSSGMAEESKEEADLQEEKSGDMEGDEEDEQEEEEEFELGPEQILFSPGPATVFSTSSLASGMDWSVDVSTVLGGSEFANDSEHDPLQFADGDEDQTILVDLGGSFAPGRFGAKFCLRKGEDEFKHDVFEVLVSSNNIEFFKYGSCEDFTSMEMVINSPADGTTIYNYPPFIQYVKFRFGSKAISVSKLFASGYTRVKVVKELPCPILCSDGRYLTFLSAKRLSKEEPDCKLRVTIVDPLHKMLIKSDNVFDFDISANELDVSTFASNGEFLVMVHRTDFKLREKKEKDVDFTCVVFNLLTHKEQGSHRVTFTDKTGYPQAVSYDSRNNCLWSWDNYDSRVLRWRNAGYAPRFLPPRPATQEDLLLSEFPQYRLEALAALKTTKETAPAAEAANILCQIDRLADIHSPPPFPTADSKAYDEIEVASAGFEDGCYCRLMHRGQIVLEAGRGFNIALLNNEFEVVDTRTFDTHGSSAASDRMADFIETIEEGSVVMVGIMDSAKAELSSRGISALKSLGADRLDKLTTRASYALIGCKGCDAGAANVTQIMVNKKEGPAVVKQRIPSPRLPLVVESAPATLKMLVGLITKQYQLFKEHKATDIDNVILLTCIRLCTTNIFHLLRGSPSEEIAEYLSSDERAALIAFVMELINEPPKQQGGFVIARAALRLFINSIDILYVSAADKCSLLIQYLKEFVDGTLSALEKSVLELLLRQMSNPMALAKIINANDPSLLVASLASIAEKETASKMQRFGGGSGDGPGVEEGSGVGDASVQMLSTLCNMILSQGIDDFSSSTDITPQVKEGVSKIIQLFLTISEISASVIDKGLAANAALTVSGDSGAGSGRKLDQEIDELIKNSPTGALLPIVLFNLARLASVSAEKFLSSSDVPAVSSNLGKCLSSVQNILSKLPKKELSPKVVSDNSIAKTATQTIESPHPYESNSDLNWDLTFPNALRMTIVFDAETKTENNYDYVIIWKDSTKQEKWHEEEKFSGRGGNEKFPGVNGVPPLVIEGNSAYVEFHSDGSNEDWGFRFTATAEFKPSAASVQRHWAFDLERQLGYCGAQVAGAMIVGNHWNTAMERPYMNVIEDDMLQGEFRRSVDLNSLPDNMKLLFDLAHDRTDPATDAFCKIMKKKVLEDRGQVEDINRAVYATAAALIKYNGLATEALAVANGSRPAPSDALIKVWKSSQKMRHYFDLSDLKAVQSIDVLPPPPPSGPLLVVGDDDDLPPAIGLTRGPSLYSGAGADTKRNASDCVVARCQFLLRIDDAMPNSEDTSEQIANPSAGKKMWQLLSKSTAKIAPKLQRDMSVENKWHNVVGAAQFANQLKELISYRRMAAQRKGGTASITERVLSFVQSDASVTQLEQVRSLRDERAKLRAAGLKLINDLIGSNASPFCVSMLVSCVQRAFRDAQSPDRPAIKAHYLNSIEGASPGMCGEVVGQFSNFIRGCTAYIVSATEKLSPDKEEYALQKSVILTCLRALAFDYDTTTHNILLKAGIISMIGALTKSNDDEIRSRAWSLYELLLLRCSGISSSKDLPDEPTDFSANVVSFIISELDRTAAPLQLTSSATAPSHFPITICGPQAREIKPDSLGFTYPHIQMGVETTICLWVRRQAGDNEAVLGLDAAPAPKMRVIRGPDWDIKLRDDGEKLFNRGTITKVEGNGSVSVAWDGVKSTRTYKCGAVVDGKKVFEVTLIDESVGGHIFSKGSPALFENGDDIKWSNFGLAMLPDSRLCFVAANGKQNWFTHASKSRVPSGEWTFIAIVQDTSKHFMYVNGELDSEVAMPPSLVYPDENAKDIHIVESPHPYLDNSDSYTVVDVEGCLGYTITFDEQSRTELNYDFVKFYKDDSHTEHWGAEKYHGGRGSSNRNFPGVNGNPPLHIPAGRFVVHFKSDGSNNEWGYKIYCAMEMPIKEDETKAKYTNLNNLPFYIGQTPSYVTNICLSSSLDGEVCNMGVFTKAVSADEIVDLKNSTTFTSTSRLDEKLCLSLISMLRRSCEIPGTPVSSALSCPQVINATLKLVSMGPHMAAISSLRLCSSLLPNADPEVVDMQASKVGLCELSPGCFVEMLLRTMGNTFNSWRGFLKSETKQMASCGEASFGTGWESVLLLHSLLASDKWRPLIVERVGHVIDNVIPATLEALLTIARQEAAKPTGDLGKALHVSPADLNISFGVLGLLCGAPDGLNVGAKARCTVGEGEGILEECTILSPTYPQVSDDPLKNLEPRIFGNAIVVVLDSQPMEYIIVDRRNVAPADRSMSPAVESFLKAQESRLQALYTLFVRSDCSDQRPVLKPKVIESDKQLVVESKHPYSPNESTYKEVLLKGAKSYRIEFDPQSRTVNDEDFVRFYKDESHSELFGESKYYGKDSSQNWPGVPGRDKPPLIINADSFIVHFKSDAYNTSKDWGFKFTVKAHCIEKTSPPMVPPLIHLATASDMKSYALKSLDFMLRNCPWFIKPVVPLIKDLAFSAMTPSPKFDVGSVAMKPLVIESAHPYENNMNMFTPYCIKGAKKLTIIFDPQTRTESGCDHVKFFKDASQGEIWGEQYTGGKDNGSSNWPGMNGRPPLVIPSDHFVLHFKTDSSVVDWGYKFTVIADGGGGGSDDLDKLSAADRSFRHNCIQQFFLEAPARMPYPTNLSQFAAGDAPKNPLLLNDAAVSLLVAESVAPVPESASTAVVVRRAKPKPMKTGIGGATDEVLGPILFNTEMKLNTENVVCFPSMDSFHTNQMRHYCGRNVGRENYQPSESTSGCCDGRCGPTNGCQCRACHAVDTTDLSSRPRPRPSDGTTRPADSCRNMHQLQLCTRESGWSCDGRNDPGGCKSGSGGNDSVKNGSRWRCEQCDFDYCGLCLSARMVVTSSSHERKKNAPAVDQYFISLPAVFYVNGADCNNLKIYVYKTPESEVSTIAEAWEEVTATAEDGDWLRVTTKSGKSGWAQRKSRDLIYLLPDCGEAEGEAPAVEQSAAPASSRTDLVTLEDEATSGSSLSSSSSLKKHPMYEVLDDVVAKAGAKKSILPSPSDVLRGRSAYIESAEMMASTVTSIGYAKSCVATCLAHWPANEPFSVDYFGGETLFLSYVRAAFLAQDTGVESGVADVSDLNAIKTRILDLVRSENQAGGDNTCAMLINFALRQLNDSLKTSTLRPTKAVVKYLESPHPYRDNMDEMYELSIPGAKWLKIVFDKQSSTEKDCDYVEVYKDRSKGTKWSSTKYTGRANSGDKCFAGVNSVPPLVVRNDNCYVFFHTDSSNTDWGWKICCYGIMEEPTEEEVAAYEDRQNAPDRPRPDLAYWLLDFLAMEESTQAQKVLFSASTIKTLREVMDSMPNSMKTPVVHLITNMLQTISRVDISPECKNELELFRKSIVSLANALHRDEGMGAAGEVSQVLQAVMQAVIVFDTALVSITQKNEVSDVVKLKEEKLIQKQGEVPLFISDTPLSELAWANTGGVQLSDDGSVRKSTGASTTLAATGAAGSPPEKSMFSKLTGGFSLGSGGKQKPIEVVADSSPSGLFSPESVVLNTNGFSKSFGFSVKLESTDGTTNPFLGAVGIAVGGDLVLKWSTQMLHVQGHEAVAFGPLVNIGDIVSVAVNFDEKTVDFYRNFAYVGRALGPANSGAYVEGGIFDENAGAFFPAISLVSGDVSVHFVTTPALVHEAIDGSSADGNAMQDSTDWIHSYLETSNLLQACCTREIPSAMLLSTFLPQCEDSKKVVIESAHPYLAMPRNENIRIEGAQKLIVHIDNQSKVDEDDVIRLSCGSGSSASETCFKSLNGGTQSDLLKASLCPGDRVVRGPSWTWGDQDGGVGNIGTVTNVLAWKGVPGTAVEVLWDSQSKLLSPKFAGMYRWGFEGKRDVVCIGHGVGKRPLTFDGDSLNVEVIPADSSRKAAAGAAAKANASSWGGCQRFDGSASLVKLEGDFELGGDFTIECWVRPQCMDGHVAPILSRQIEIEGRQNQLSLALVKQDDIWTLELGMLNISFQNYFTCNGGVVPIESWSHVAATFSGTTGTLYIDGIEVSSSSNVSGDRSPSMGAALIIGANEGGEYYKGHIYDLRLWDVARRADEIQESKNAPFVDPPNGIVLSMLMDDNAFDGGMADYPQFDSSVAQPVLPVGTLFGYKITIIPVFSLQQIMTSPLFKAELDQLIQQYSLGSLRHDVNLVRYINQVMREKKKDLSVILNCAWSELAPSAEELTRWPVLEELCHNTRASARNTPASSPIRAQQISHADQPSASEGSEPVEIDVFPEGPDPLELRFKLIQVLNRKLHESSMKYIDLCMNDKPWSIAFLLLQCRGVVLEAVKSPFWETALAESSVSGGQFDLRLSRPRAAKFARTGAPDHDGRFMTFSQAFRAMHSNNPSTLRRSGQLYNTIFLGEHSQDVGGPYRESFAQYCAELQSVSLPLLVRTPNGRQSAGQNREMWVLNPGAISLTHMEMFAFLGKLMGIAIRSKEYLALNIAPFIWKLLVKDIPTIEDLEGIDYHQVKVLKEIRHSDLSPEIFAMAFEDIGFTCVSTDDRTVDLVPDGSNVALSYANRVEYCNLLENYRVHEFDQQAEAIRRGLATIVPMRLLSLFTWDQLELMVCGLSSVDISLLRSVTEYSSCSANDVHVRNFWQVLEEFSEEEKAAFLRFTWGRSRLPLVASAFAQRFKLQSFGKSPADNYLPVSHTCFFSLELPRYSTIDVMRERLRYAITHCLAIDGDDTSIGMQAAAMGWEE